MKVQELKQLLDNSADHLNVLIEFDGIRYTVEETNSESKAFILVTGDDTDE